MDKLKLSEWGELLKTGGAQMSRLVSGKVKEMLQTPTPESKMVDEATLETMEEPNWGLNLRICAMINSQEFSGTEIVKAIKRKFSGKSVVSQRLSLDLLEACTSNCEKVFSEVASEKVLDEMARMIENPQTDQGNRDRALQLIRAWESLRILSICLSFFRLIRWYILKAETEPKPIKEDLTVSLLDKCKQSQPDIQRIIESTTDDEAMLFEALNLHDELQQVISQYEELEAGIKSREQLPEICLPAQLGHQNETKIADYPMGPICWPLKVDVKMKPR
ncbi:hypothetical protein NC652_004935 [Populus alba x Populus x berolinensis]|nr:hypothetical protein NC652_004935 [Populus alba x Populus x berolinensis]